MAEGGCLLIETVLVDSTGTVIAQTSDDGASFLRLRVEDTGVGMDERVKAHLFEPFLRQKKAGVVPDLDCPLRFLLRKSTSR